MHTYVHNTEWKQQLLRGFNRLNAVLIAKVSYFAMLPVAQVLRKSIAIEEYCACGCTTHRRR
jgi:hypothetical protein